MKPKILRKYEGKEKNQINIWEIINIILFGCMGGFLASQFHIISWKFLVSMSLSFAISLTTAMTILHIDKKK